MFESLVDKFSGIFKKLRSKGKLSPQEVESILKELRMVLLESDVHYKVAKDLINRVKERAVGREVLESVTPGEMVIKILWDEIRKCLGGETQNLNISALPSFLLLVGLQGSGKTTTCAKLALRLKRQGHFPLLVSTDTRRPAAKEQLKTLAQNAQIDFFDEPDATSPLEVVKKARVFARQKSNDVVIVDTAGRLHVEEMLLAELRELVEQESFQETLLVLDATTGQEAVKVAKSFEEWVKPTGIILTKVDTDARGGAVLSIVSQTGWPVKLVGTGEKLEQIETFHPDRMASRILGLGDTLTLIEKIEKAIEKESEEKLVQKLKKEEITLNDFLDEIKRLRSVSSFEEIVGMLPGNLRSNLSMVDGEKNLKKVEAIICSMTPQERQNPSIINASRKKRIARGSGTSIQEVNKLLKQFEEFKKLWKQMHKGKFSPLRKRGIFGWKI
ncbi:signal recognition particle protein [Thermatribacter velox]|uniref:Signal recognition particle protein n=1 Tax=Thermatribacter velox TaxID=3039681 RepID=A0ABZ2Y861_9BACT